MERALKKLLRVYPIVRNWTAVSSCAVPTAQPIQNVAQMYSTYLTDRTQKKLDIKPRIGKRYMSNHVKIMQDPIKILDAIVVNYTNMSIQNAFDTLDILYEASKKRHTNIYKIEKHPGFVQLCDVINKNIRLMKIGEIIEILKIFTYLKIPTDTFLIQSLLQMIRTTMNEIPLRDLIFIVFLLKKMDSTPLRDALLIALPLVIETQLPTKLDPDDMFLLTYSLRFLKDNNINNPELYNIILKSLSKYEDNLNTKTATSILYSLSSMTYLPPIASQLLSNVQNVLTAKVKTLHLQDIMQILSRVTFVVTKNQEYKANFYNETMIDAFVNSAISLNITFNNGIELLRSLNQLNYAHIPFLEYLAAKCFEMPDLLRDASYFKVFTFLEGFINADYKPVFWDTIRDAILANEIENNYSRSLIKFTLYLTALDCYSPILLNKVFSQDVNSKSLRNLSDLLLLYQAVKTLYPMYDGPWLSQNMLECAFMLKPASPACSFKAALEQALGGPQYVYNDVKTKLGHCIDHVIVMRKGGYPVAINTGTSNMINTIYIEGIQTPSESQMIFIFNLPDDAYAVNSQRVKSTWLLKMRSVEALTKSNTIAISSSSWIKLPDFEKVPYLMQAIKLKCKDLSILAN